MSRKLTSLNSPRGLRANLLAAEGEQLLVLSYPIDSPDLPANLTHGEREVLRLLLAGKSNQDIAISRGRSKNTVANQVASIFSKLNIGSRAELGTALRRLSKDDY